jgi:hypothetical protein
MKSLALRAAGDRDLRVAGRLDGLTFAGGQDGLVKTMHVHVHGMPCSCATDLI